MNVNFFSVIGASVAIVVVAFLFEAAVTIRELKQYEERVLTLEERATNNPCHENFGDNCIFYVTDETQACMAKKNPDFTRLVVWCVKHETDEITFRFEATKEPKPADEISV